MDEGGDSVLGSAVHGPSPTNSMPSMYGWADCMHGPSMYGWADCMRDWAVHNRGNMRYWANSCGHGGHCVAQRSDSMGQGNACMGQRCHRMGHWGDAMS